MYSFSKRPLLRPVIFFSLGIVTFLEGNDLIFIIVIAAILFMITAISLFNYKFLLKIILCLSVYYSCGYVISKIKCDINSNDHFSKKNKIIRIKGKVKAPPEDKRKYRQLILSAVSVSTRSGDYSCSGNVLVWMPISDQLLQVGDELVLKSKVNCIKNSNNGSGFEAASYYQSQNIYYQTFLKSRDYIVYSNMNTSILQKSKDIQMAFIRKIKRILGEGDAFDLTSAIITGYKNNITNEKRSYFSKSGVVHVLCVSGMHTGMIFLMIRQIMLILFYGRKVPEYTWLFTLIPLWFYAFITGLTPSVTRASFMLSLWIFSKCFNKYADPINILCASALVLMLINPFIITHAGFQLSYIAVGGIMVFHSEIATILQPLNKIMKTIWGACCISISAQLTTTPLSVYLFGIFPVYFLIGNLMAIPITAIILYASILLLPFSDLSFFAEAYRFIIEISTTTLLNCLQFLSNSSFSTLEIKDLNIIDVLLIYKFIYLIYKWGKTKSTSYLILILAGLIITINYHFTLS